MKIFEFKHGFVVLADIQSAVIKKTDRADYPWELSIIFKRDNLFNTNFINEKDAQSALDDLMRAYNENT